jgi:acetyl-CoA carboxylase / biotin carboxylase 1
MATPDDLMANAEYIRQADEIVDVPGGTNNNNYANVNLICEIAERLKVDAVMPMWGHASENPALPTLLKAIKSHRISFIGPPAEPMQALGDKIGSTIIAQSAGVPVIGWNGNGIIIDYEKDGLSDEIYAKANVITSEDALECSNRIGYPVMIKASEGGGGKGIRKVLKAEDVFTSFRQVQAEIPGSPIFIMSMASKARHLEVQLLADKYGNAIALSGRDCSIQRRHQKIIEEGPAVAAPINLFKKMEASAVALAKTVGYCNAGTVEFLYMEETQTYAFLELNPRLQVEHPVTENILGINLPCCQLQVAMGIPLHRIADIRKMYGRHKLGKDNIDFDYTERAVPPRHCVAVRITAENPEASFRPTGGNIQELKFMSSIDVWGYFSVGGSGNIHEFSDSQFGHIFASGPDRESARRACVMALKELQIRGNIRTTTEYIIKMMQSNDFINNNIDTDWLDGRITNHEEISIQENIKFAPSPNIVATCGAALQGYQFFENRDNNFLSNIMVGQIPSKDCLVPSIDIELIFNGIKYLTTIVQGSKNIFTVICNNLTHRVFIRKLSDGGYLLEHDGQSHTVYTSNESSGSIRMILDGHTCMFTPEYDPTRLTSSVAGKLARHLVSNGSHINKGDPYVEVEVMKMYMPLKAEESGIINFEMSEGATLNQGDLIATMKLGNKDAIIKADIFKGKLGEPFLIDTSNLLPHLRKRNAFDSLQCVLDGYPQSKESISNYVKDIIETLADSMTPYYEIIEAMSVLGGRIDQNLMNDILIINDRHKRECIEKGKGNIGICYPAKIILKLIHTFGNTLDIPSRALFNQQTINLWKIAEQYVYDIDVRVLSSFTIILDKYLQVESMFDKLSFNDVVTELRKTMNNDLSSILSICRSHSNLETKNILLLYLIDEMKNYPLAATVTPPELPSGIFIRNETNIRQLKMKLNELSKLRQSCYSSIAYGTNLILMEQYSLKAELRKQKLDEAVNDALVSGDKIGFGDRLLCIEKFIQSNIIIRDILIHSLQHDKDYRIAAMEIYLRKIYQKSHVFIDMKADHYILNASQEQSSCIQFKFTTKSIATFSNIVDETKDEKNLVTYDSLVQKETQKLSIDKCRYGVFIVAESFNHLVNIFSSIIDKLLEEIEFTTPENVIHIVLLNDYKTNSTPISEEEWSNLIGNFLTLQKEILLKRHVKRVTVIVGHSHLNDTNSISLDNVPTESIFTFRAKMGYIEDRLYRHIDAPHAYHLNLPQLSEFILQHDTYAKTTSGNVHIYFGKPKNGIKGLSCYFARLVSFASDVNSNEVESLFTEALDSLNIAICHQERENVGFRRKNVANHVFINVVLPDSVVDIRFYEEELRRICTKYWYKMVPLAISNVDMNLTCKLNVNAEPVHIRLVANNPTGFVLNIDSYYQASTNDSQVIYKSINNFTGRFNDIPISTPHDISEKFQYERALALASSDTLYAYDWPILFEEAVMQQWRNSNKSSHGNIELPKGSVFRCKELVLCKPGSSIPLNADWCATDALSQSHIVPISREPGKNDCGMVAWLAEFSTPEFPNGRKCVFICNDITTQAGSFGTKEDAFFFMASQYARKFGIPRVYIAANSGARIGMANSLKDIFKICWTDINDPAKGFDYIYLAKNDYDELINKYKNNMDKFPLCCTQLEVTTSADGDIQRYRIDDIIGEEPDLGVENLMGSGLIAGETSRAYDDIFTLTMVVGRTVGIGAYLVRLGQRTIQRTQNSPIILTGHQALNKLMGRNIYTANDQLGGPMIMFPNGVSHLLADDHMDSVNKTLDWLRFVPSHKGGHLPLRDIKGIDIIDRDIEFAPQKNVVYDARHLATGVYNGDNWESGFFDKDSFIETLAGWAKTVITGRACLGGIPMGVIITESRTSEALKPADPADITSQEKMVQQAGGVWFPDSAYKTSQALRDFQREGLPCIIFANWRGFSGGQRDMFDEVLKFGSMIVDALVAYQQPLFVYIPPFAELRGGAWVVVDHTINDDVMEFYAAETARGGVLEAAGAASIKYRERDIIKTAHRTDKGLIELDIKLKCAKNNNIINDIMDMNNIINIENEIKLREKQLFGVFQQVAVHFADLHDTPGRMKAKGVIRDEVKWSQSRSYFFWRLSRRLIEFDLVDSIINATLTLGRPLPNSNSNSNKKDTINDLKECFFREGGLPELWEDDKYMLKWLSDNGDTFKRYAQEKTVLVSANHLTLVLQNMNENSLKMIMNGLTSVDRKRIMDALK